MKPKQILILGIVLCILVLGVAVKALWKPKELVTEEFTSLGIVFDPSLVERIRIGGADDEEAFELVKTQGGWNLPDRWNARANGAKIERFLKGIRDAKGELRAEGRDLWDDFGIHPREAFQISLSDAFGTPLFEWRIGKKKWDHRYPFVRQVASERVYLTDADLFSFLGMFGDPARQIPKSDPWAALDLLNLRLDQIQEIRAERFSDQESERVMAIERSSAIGISGMGSWQYVNKTLPFEMDQGKVERFLMSLVGWRAARILEPGHEAYGLDRPAWQMTVTLEEGKEVTVTVGWQDQETESYFVKVSQEPVVFQVSKLHFEEMDIDDSYFFRDNPLRIASSKIEKLVIRSKKKKVNVLPQTERPEVLAEYLGHLEQFRVSKLLFSASAQKKVKVNGPYSLEIQFEGKPTFILDVGDWVSKKTRERVTQVRGKAQPFAISEATFKSLFEDLDVLVT